ncbi:hypothetical protein M427DRAFT_352204 [Gonapodya prolifera JEL478]|uniref:Uncharacterized protein n=1 Tax=Gonapodya prolifera (strain JEL478) TaxID=1344416 RepID=A0A139ABN3_GONPJ|nr:hypothetical protein M427DRAFT_352204 [Gonapodya prolifera JEL478]|eukprot:KXS14242.1 hypothetical protein M427DRAFT_352204 [Gonapodya prolifera JEL478]
MGMEAGNSTVERAPDVWTCGCRAAHRRWKECRRWWTQIGPGQPWRHTKVPSPLQKTVQVSSRDAISLPRVSAHRPSATVATHYTPLSSNLALVHPPAVDIT